MKNPKLFPSKPTLKLGVISRLAFRFVFLVLLLAGLVGIINGVWSDHTGISEAAVPLATPSPASSKAATANPTLISTPVPAVIITPTINPEWEANQNQTDGILLGAAVLVLIIVGGTLSTIRLKFR